MLREVGGNKGEGKREGEGRGEIEKKMKTFSVGIFNVVNITNVLDLKNLKHCNEYQ